MLKEKLFLVIVIFAAFSNLTQQNTFASAFGEGPGDTNPPPAMSFGEGPGDTNPPPVMIS
jgi:hypothetical protein